MHGFASYKLTYSSSLLVVGDYNGSLHCRIHFGHLDLFILASKLLKFFNEVENLEAFLALLLIFLFNRCMKLMPAWYLQINTAKIRMLKMLPTS